jgi:hypothetical protein
MPKELKAIGERLYWAYANLAMAHDAVTSGKDKYSQTSYRIRSRLYAGLMNGTMNVGALVEDERLKLILPQACSYCGSRTNLAADHLVPLHSGGPDLGDNLVWACRSCNSSKGAKDVLEWLQEKEMFPSLLLLRRYLKLAISMLRVHVFGILALKIRGQCQSR